MLGYPASGLTRIEFFAEHRGKFMVAAERIKLPSRMKNTERPPLKSHNFTLL
jgi:hypothetical protein